MVPYVNGTPGASFGYGWSWWAIAFLAAFAVVFLVAFWRVPYR